MSKLSKRANPPFGMTVAGAPSPHKATCGVCRKQPGKKRFYNTWRAIDVCEDPVCNQQGAAWAGNSPFSKRVNDPPRVWREPVPVKFMSRKAEAVAKPPSVRARAR